MLPVSLSFCLSGLMCLQPRLSNAVQFNATIMQSFVDKVSYATAACLFCLSKLFVFTFR
jgi:hypothetical protein